MAYNNNKKQKNYFTNNIERFGDNFIEQFDAKKLRMDARRVFSDIAFGRIDYDKYWQYFTNSLFINALIDVANTEYIIHNTSYMAMDCYARQYGTNPQFSAVMTYHRRNAEAHSILLQAFMNIRSNRFTVESVSSLKVLSNKMKEYAQDLTEPIFSMTNPGSSDMSVVPAEYSYEQTQYQDPLRYGYNEQNVTYSVPVDESFYEPTLRPNFIVDLND